MKTKTFKAKELREALAMVRRELGPEALIISTRQVTPVLGLGPPMLEVTAGAADDSGDISLRERAPRLLNLVGGIGRARRREAEDALWGGKLHDGWFQEEDQDQGAEARPALERGGSIEADAGLEARLLPLQREVQALRAQLHQVTQSTAAGPGLKQDVDELRAVIRTMNNGARAGEMTPDLARLALHGLERPLSESLLQRAREIGGDLEAALRKAVAERVTVAGPVGVSAKVAAFIGPTGVGKTTTIAKIAARAALIDGAKVALLTVDTFRVGAIDQLQRYADLMELPLQVAGTSTALRAAVQSNAGADLILLDTAGRGPRDVAQLAALRELLGSADSVEVHLCLSATTRAREQALALQSYRPLHPTRLCITKLDEAVALGEIYGLHTSSKLPISYLGTGQRVPEDLELCTPDGLAERLLARQSQAEGAR